MFFRNSNLFGRKKKNKRSVLEFLLIFLGIVIYSITVFYCFYSLSKIEKIYSFPDFPPPKIQTKTEEEKLSIPNIKEFGIKIDKLNIVVPVIKNVDAANKNLYNKELKRGVAHMKGTALPGQGGNIFIFGHSSSTIGTGPYSKIFVKLNELKKGDKITIFYKNKEFHYLVFEKKIVEKNDVSVVNPTKNEQVTLMTCWPIGTADKRLIIKSSLVK